MALAADNTYWRSAEPSSSGGVPTAMNCSMPCATACATSVVKLSRPASVVGDGVLAVDALIEAKNQERVVRAVPGHHPIVIDRDLERDFPGRGKGHDMRDAHDDQARGRSDDAHGAGRGKGKDTGKDTGKGGR